MENITDILIGCEKNGTAAPYLIDPLTYKYEGNRLFAPSYPKVTVPIALNLNLTDIIVISDLHIGSGRDQYGVYPGTENFFADDGFTRFIAYTIAATKKQEALLVLNGDTFDFLRVTEFPGKVPPASVSKTLRAAFYNQPATPIIKPASTIVNAEFDEWRMELEQLGISKSTDELCNSISKTEKKYGLETDEYKTIYKLMRISKGHPVFFAGLAAWLQEGNRILITKGNHDLELVWPAVRNYIRLLISRAVKTTGQLNALQNLVLPNLFFADDAVLIDRAVYVEHGHRYDKFGMVLDAPFLQRNPQQVNIPFGSFFNRYVINRVELFYPYLDKLRPTGNIIPVLVSDNFPLALRVFGSQLPFAIRMLFTNARYIWYMLRRVVPLLLLLVPLIIYGIAVYKHVLKPITDQGEHNVFLKYLFSVAGGAGSLVLSYFIARLVAWLQLTEPSSLEGFAYRLYKNTNGIYPVMTMGHTHNPGAYQNGEGVFFNSGTWIPVIENSTAELRQDRIYSFLHLVRDGKDAFKPVSDQLQRWNDDAGRAEAQLLLKRKF